ncbi:MAG: DNA methylase, partial [candidate division WOR-3 bacterium]
PVPDEHLPPKETLGFRVQRYGILKWGDLFNSRQKLALITFTEKVRLAYKKMIEEGYEEEFAKAVVSYLGLGVNRLATYLVVLTRWRSDVLSFERAFDRQALPMVWDFGEVNPFSDVRGQWDLNPIVEALKHISNVSTASNVTQASATSLPYPDNFFDAVFTDPPYYDNVPYSYLSDFFYVWLKRTLGDIYPELFATPLTPKTNEIVAYSHNEGGFEAGKKFFEENLKKAFQEIYRVLKSEGIAVIVYAHKSTAGWETLINSLLDCGLVITASWPIDTEMKSRLRANESAALASSIYLVARKIQRKPIGYLNEVKDEIKQHLKQKLQNLWKEGVSGGDFFIAGIGSAIEVFGKYEKVMDYEGNIIRADRLLEFVREIVTDYAVREILHNGVAGEISPLTRFYILYRWLFGEARAEFDEVRKLASSSGFEISDYFNRGFIKKEKEFIKILGPHERDLEEFELGANSELIDVLHKCLVLWSQSRNDEIVKLLHESGYGYKEVFYKVAQAVSECLPIESKEKKMLDGFLTGKERYIDGIKKQSEPKQSR